MANPLTLLMPIKSGFLELPALAATLLMQQKALHEALNTIGTVHYARILILDRTNANLRPDLKGPYVLAVITEYDGSFQAYIGDFVAKVGDVFDALMPFIVGGQALVPVKNNVDAFTAFIDKNDVSQHFPNTALYDAYPQTVQQIKAAFS
jgi:hypothetical protein